MNATRRILAGAVAITTLLFGLTAAAPAAQAAASDGFYTTVPSNLARLKPGAVIRSEPESTFLPTLDGQSAAYRILYRSTGQLG